MSKRQNRARRANRQRRQQAAFSANYIVMYDFGTEPAIGAAADAVGVSRKDFTDELCGRFRERCHRQLDACAYFPLFSDPHDRNLVLQLSFCAGNEVVLCSMRDMRSDTSGFDGHSLFIQSALH